MKTLTSFLVVLCVVGAAAQDPTSDEKAFEKAIALWEEEKLYDALDAFRAFMVNYPESSLVARAHFNVGYAHFALGDLRDASSVFKEILSMEYNELDSNNLMEPYMLYKHNSARYLAEISLEVKEWDDAEKYIQMFDEKYPYQHFCGNEWAAYYIMKSTMDARLHEGQGKIDLAVQDLVPHIFYNGLASNREALSLLKELLRRNYSQSEISQELESALASIKIVKREKEQDGFLTLYGKDIRIREYSVDTRGLSYEAGLQKIVRSNPVFVAFLGEK